ncbi:MAG: cobalamin-binding protein [Candidatus Omnitrophota bacterium]|nr:cobalamin-binding protein [Candidatus Omnitrophota bacterium]
MRYLIKIIILTLIFSINSELPAKELRIISVTPSATEIACALGLFDNLVGVSTFCDYPQEVKSKEKIGSFSDPSIEKIISLKPDLVLATGLEQAYTVLKLKKMNINVFIVDPKNFEEFFACVKGIGEICGRQFQSAALIESMRSSIARISEKVDLVKESERPKVYLEIWHDPIMTVGKGSLVDEMIKIAGGINITSDAPRPFSQFSPELIIERNPDVIILGYMNMGVSATGAVSKRLGWQNINAVRYGRVYDDIDSDLLFRPGPRLVRGTEELYKRFYK